MEGVRSRCGCLLPRQWYRPLLSFTRMPPSTFPLTLQGAGAGDGFEVQKYGDGRVALIGFPSGSRVLGHAQAVLC